MREVAETVDDMMVGQAMAIPTRWRVIGEHVETKTYIRRYGSVALSFSACVVRDPRPREELPVVDTCHDPHVNSSVIAGYLVEVIRTPLVEPVSDVADELYDEPYDPASPAENDE